MWFPGWGGTVLSSSHLEFRPRWTSLMGTFESEVSGLKCDLHTIHIGSCGFDCQLQVSWLVEKVFVLSLASASQPVNRCSNSGLWPPADGTPAFLQGWSCGALPGDFRKTWRSQWPEGRLETWRTPRVPGSPVGGTAQPGPSLGPGVLTYNVLEVPLLWTWMLVPYI